MLKNILGTSEFYFPVEENKEKTKNGGYEFDKILDLLPLLSQGNANALLRNTDIDIAELNKKIGYLKVHDYCNYLMLKPYIQQLENNATHISDLFDKVIFPDGIIPGELITVTAPSGGGKTALCIMLAVSLLSGYNPFHSEKFYTTRSVIYVSLEQTKDQIVHRMLSTISAMNSLETAFPFSSSMTGKISDRKTFYSICKLFELYMKNLRILSLNDFKGTPSVHDICDVITSETAGMDRPVIIVDQYENILDASNPVNDVVARTLKVYAEKNGYPIFLQSQLNKSSAESAIQKDGSEAPNKITAHSLKGTSGLLHQSSSVLVITKDGKKSMEQGHDTMIVTISLKKSRYSTLNQIKLYWYPALNLFIDHKETKDQKTSKEENE